MYSTFVNTIKPQIQTMFTNSKIPIQTFFSEATQILTNDNLGIIKKHEELSPKFD